MTSCSSSSTHQRTTICVTAGTGFIASHIIKKLLEQGHDVRTTVRDPKSKRVDFLRELEKSEPVQKSGGTLTIFQADLTVPGSFDEAFSNGCEIIIHTAAVVKTTSSNPWDEIISPAVNGATDVAKAAAKYYDNNNNEILSSASDDDQKIDEKKKKKKRGIRRIVQTSSVSSCHQPENDRRPDKQNKPFDESEWRLDLRPHRFPYEAAKVLSERAINEHFPGEVIAILPSFTIGPMLSSEVRSTLSAVKLFANREMPLAPSPRTSFVDVRDVADAHIAAAFSPKTTTTTTTTRVQRFLCTQQENRPMLDIGISINKQYYPRLSAPTIPTPSWLLWGLSFFDSRISPGMLEERLIERPDYDNSKIRKELVGFKFNYCDLDVSVKDCVESMVKFGVVKLK